MNAPTASNARRSRLVGRGRPPRRVLVALVVLAGLVVLLVIADRVAERVAARATAEQLRTSQHLAADPDVRFTGFPFLTQALRGRLDEVDLTASDVATPVVPLARLQTRLHGVRAGLGAALAGRLQSVPVDSADASASVRYADLNPLVATRLSGTAVGSSLRDPVLADRNGQLAVTAQAAVLGASVPVEVDCDVTVDDTGIAVVPRRARLPLLGDQALPLAVSTQAAVRVPTQGLPFGFHVRGVTVGPDELEVSGDSAGFVATSPG